MPHYYFHVRRGQITILDHEGIELADPVDAEVAAAQRAQQVVNGEAMNEASARRVPGRPCLNSRSRKRKGVVLGD